MLAFAPLDAATGVAFSVVSTLASTVAPLAGGVATAAAIVLFTLGVRLLISPLTYAQVRGERRRAALAPRIAGLQRRHRGDPARLGTEVAALYRAEGVSPAAGCLPALLQMPFFLVMYRLFTSPTVTGRPNGLLTERLFGVPLGSHLGDAAGAAGAALPVFAVLLALLALLAWWSSRRMRRAGVLAGAPADAGTGLAAVGRVLPLLPYATPLVAAVAPLAAGLYLVTTTAFTALEHALLRRPPATSVNP